MWKQPLSRVSEVELVPPPPGDGIQWGLGRRRRPNRREQSPLHLTQIGEPAGGVALEGSADRAHQGLGQAQRLRVDGRQRLVNDHVDEGRHRPGLEWTAPGEQLVEDHPHRPHVGPVIDLGTLEQLR